MIELCLAQLFNSSTLERRVEWYGSLADVSKYAQVRIHHACIKNAPFEVSLSAANTGPGYSIVV